jgi:multidrug efflux system outer membrane protein
MSGKIRIAVQLLVFLGITLFSGCMLGPDFQKSQYTGPARYRFDSASLDTVVNLRWWELFGDSLLDTLIYTALENNKDVRIAARHVEAARASLGYTKAGRWPQVIVAGGVSVSGTPGDVNSGFQLSPEFNWEIGFWGKYRRMNEAAQADYLSTEYAKRMVQLSLITAVATTYFTILQTKDQLEVSHRTLASRDSGVVIMQDKFEGGMISLMDLNQAKIQRDIAAAMIPLYKRIIALNENTLSLLLGGMPRSIITGKPFHQHRYEMVIPPGIPSQLLQRRPDILQAEAHYHAMLANVGVAEALRWPSISLTGMLGAASSDLTSLNAIGLTWSAGANLFSPLFQFGQNKRRAEIARTNAQAALLQYEKTVQQAFKDVEDALVSIATYRDELTVQESRKKTAVASEELSYIRYDEGSTTYLEVLEQQRQSFSAQLDVLTTRLNLLNSYILLYKALGGGWLTPDEEKNYNNNPGTVSGINQTGTTK